MGKLGNLAATTYVLVIAGIGYLALEIMYLKEKFLDKFKSKG